MRYKVPFVFLVLIFLVGVLSAQSDIPELDNHENGLPVRELMVFKDGHALVYHRGSVAPDAEGNVAFRDLPQPILGTFWPTVTTDGWRIESTTAGWRDVKTTVSTASLGQMILANKGASIFVTEKDGTRYAARLPKDKGGLSGSIVFLKVEEGLKALPLSRIRDITFRGDKTQTTHETSSRQRVLGFQLKPGSEASPKKVDVGLSYVSSGFRWIPSYRIEINGEGKAKLHMSAILVNDLRDLKVCRLQLVVGVPNFSFAAIKDPMALMREAQQMAQSAGNFSNDNGFTNRLSNMIQSNSAVFNPVASDSGSALNDRLKDGRNHEDLFVFTVPDVTLKKGDRMTVSLGSFELPYGDHYVLDVPIQVPGEIGNNRHSSGSKWDRLAMQPKVMHQIRLKNLTKMPLTTAPALIFSKGRVVSQSMVRYTPSGGICSLDLTKAIDLHVQKQDYEAGRVSDAISLGNRHYHRVNYAGKITVANHDTKKVTIEVNRYLIGHMDEAPKGATLRTMSPFDDLGPLFDGKSKSISYWQWPVWWRQVNGIEKLSWTMTLDQGEESSLGYEWYYYWR
ncbi:MAG: hypothetical protein ACI97A_002353 [Planctomycetota bacterium]|jgi:hypothetical protein